MSNGLIISSLNSALEGLDEQIEVAKTLLLLGNQSSHGPSLVINPNDEFSPRERSGDDTFVPIACSSKVPAPCHTQDVPHLPRQKSISRALSSCSTDLVPKTLFGSSTSSLDTVYEPVLPESCRVYHKPLFEMFDVNTMNNSLPSDVVSFHNRDSYYYGEIGYGYGGTFHEPRDMECNPYLMKMISYLSVLIPEYSFNSAMINRYSDWKKYIPHHCDDEESIDANSDILTVSLGSSRIMQFKNLQTGQILEAPVTHGTVVAMSKESQFKFSHSILQGEEGDPPQSNHPPRHGSSSARREQRATLPTAHR